MLLPKDLCNRSPSFCALIIREETPSPLPFDLPTDVLPKLPRGHCTVEALDYRLILLLSAGGGPALPGGPFRLGVPYQDRMENPILEVHPLR